MKFKNFQSLLLFVVLFSLMATSNVFPQPTLVDREGVRTEAKTDSTKPAVGCNDNWDTTFTSNGADYPVYASVYDGSGNLYIGGHFNSVQGLPANGIAKWDGTNWSTFGSGVNGDIFAIAVDGNNIYVGGSFSSAGGSPAKNVAKWDGNSWSALGAGLGGGTHVVNAVAVYGGEVYIGGNFTTSDGSPFSGITKWDGNAYQSAGNLVGTPNALVASGGSLYAGGNIALTPGTSIGLAKFDGNTWTTLGTLENTVIKAITFSGTDMYVTGSRIVLTGQSDTQVAKFDGTNWTRLGGFFSNGIMNAIAVVGTDVYVGGYLPDPPNLFNSLAKWTGSSWTGVGSGITGGTASTDRVRTLAVMGNTLFVGGNYTTAGGQGASNMSTVTNGSWSTFSGTGIDAPAQAIGVSGTNVYVGGSFTTAGPINASRIASWNSVTQTWSPLGSGINGTVYAIAVAGNKVYAGGLFSNAGGVNATNVAVWNGTNWAALGTGVNGRVNSILVQGEDVFVGGAFSAAGGSPANRVAKWNGTSWSALPGSPVPNDVTSMAFMGDDLYVGSDTTTVDNPNYLLKYDGTTWTPLANGFGGFGIRSLAVLGTDLYVTGSFPSINGLTVNRIAKWNGSTWSALGGGLPGQSFSNDIRVGVSGNDIIATGDFTLASGGPANRIARWNGTAWTGLGDGLDASGLVINSAGGDLYVGGNFSTAGCHQSAYLARWRENVWTGSANTDWHNDANWGGNSVPPANAGVTISASDAAITSSDVTVSSLIVTSGRTLTIGAGRTLTVNGTLDLTNGSVTGPGTLIVNGSVSLNDGDINGLASLTINGDLYLAVGNIGGGGTVTMTSCRPGAVSGGSTVSYVDGILARCVNGTGTYRFPVGAGGGYAPVELSNITGSSVFAVEPRAGAFSGTAAGLPANRLQRWWNLSNGGITQTDLTFYYTDPDVTGIEGRYRAFRINAGTAEMIPSSVDRNLNKVSVPGVTSFSAWTLAEGPATYETLTGRITAPSGRGAERVLVSLMDESGNTRWALTNGTGFYRFFDVETWKPYTITLRSKRFNFNQPVRVFEFIEGAPAQNFTSTNH